MEACATAISHLQIRLPICSVILAPAANWELENYRLGMYVEDYFVPEAVILQIINLLFLLTVLMNKFI